MSNALAIGPAITIPNNAAVSNIILGREAYDDAVGIMLYGPTALDVHTYVIEVCDKEGATASDTWRVLQSSATDLNPPGVSKAQCYFDLPNAAAFRIKDQTGNVGAARTWQMSRLYRT